MSYDLLVYPFIHSFIGLSVSPFNIIIHTLNYLLWKYLTLTLSDLWNKALARGSTIDLMTLSSRYSLIIPIAFKAAS